MHFLYGNNKWFVFDLLVLLIPLIGCNTSTKIENVNASSKQTYMFTGTIPANGINPVTGQASLIVNGIEKEIIPGTEYLENDKAQIVITNAAGCYSSFTQRNIDPYRTSLFVSDGKLDLNKSVTEAITSGTYNDKGAQGLHIVSQSSNFNGLILNNGTYNLKNSTFSFLSDSDGSKVSDFTGYGAVLAVFGNKTKLVADNITINTEGVARPALFNDRGADVLIKNSTFKTEGGTLYKGYKNNANQKIMVTPPWVLGISGNTRATNLIGKNTTSTFVNCKLNSKGWGVLSTDACSNTVLTAIDSSVYVDGNPKKTGGYGSYAIGNAVENFRGCDFSVATYASILTGGTVTFSSSNGNYDIINSKGEKVFNNIKGQKKKSNIDSKAFGFLFHSQGGTVNILDGTSLNTIDSIFLVKSCGAVINIKKSFLSSANSVLLQVMDNDDTVVGMADGKNQVFNTSYDEKEGYPGIDYVPTAITMNMTPMSDKGQNKIIGKGCPINDKKDLENVAISFAGSSVIGNIYNSTGYTGKGYEISVILKKNSFLSGVICSTSAKHSTDNGKTQNTYFTESEFWKLGHVVNTPYSNGKNNISVEIDDTSTWKVTGKSFLTKLLLHTGAVLQGIVYINGKKTQIVPEKEYTGNIVVNPTNSTL